MCARIVGILSLLYLSLVLGAQVARAERMGKVEFLVSTWYWSVPLVLSMVFLPEIAFNRFAKIRQARDPSWRPSRAFRFVQNNFLRLFFLVSALLFGSALAIANYPPVACWRDGKVAMSGTCVTVSRSQ